MKKKDAVQLRRMDKKIRWLFVFSLVAFVCFMGILYQQKKSQETTRLAVYNTYSAIKKLEKINTLVVETESATRGYLLTKDTAWKKNLSLLHTRVGEAITEVGQLVKQNGHDQKSIAALEILVNKKSACQNELVNATSLTERLLQKVRSDSEAREITRSIKSLLGSMIGDEEKVLSERIARNEKDYTTGVFLALFGGIFAFVLILGVLLQLNSDIALRKIAEEELTHSESKYRSIIENAGVVMFTADINGSITFTNNEVIDLTGYTVEELAGKHFSILIDPAWMERVGAFYLNQFQKKIPATTLEFPTRSKNGQQTWVEQFAQLQFDRGRIVGFQCMVKDISEKKKIELELNYSEIKRKENESRLGAILDNTSTLIFIKDLQGRYITVNKRFKEVFGLTDEMVINKTDYDFNSKDLADHYKKLDEEVIAGLVSIESEELVETSMGSRNLLLVKFPLLDDKQCVFGISGIATDITERVQDRHALVKALKKAEEANELQEQFLANMSHEIRTPLNGIQGMTSLLIETPLTEEQKEYTNMIKRSLNNLVTIITDVLDVSNIKAGKLTLEKIAFNINEPLETVKSQFAHQVNSKGLLFEVVLDEAVPAELTGDPYRLKQVLVSLVGNAVKFTKEGHIKVLVSLKEKTEQEASVLFAITDTGIGIPPEKLNTIFESFAQADKDISRGYGGAGLGLAISKGLVQLQGGDISADSKPGQGSVFRFCISYGIQPKAANRSSDSSHFLQLRGKRFLVVEDNEVNQKLIGSVLQKVGAVVDIADNGKEAVDLFEQGHEYELVIMDLQMPVMDGYQTAVYIRQTLQLQIPIIAMTATALKGDQEKCREVGMNDFMLKPFDFNDLYKRLGRLLSGENKDTGTSAQKPAELHGLYNLSLLEELDDKESVLDVISLFLDSTPAEVKELRELVQQKKWSVLYRQAHKIKGAVAILQATNIAQLLGRIEANAKEEKELDIIVQQVEEVTKLFAEMEIRLREEQQQIKKELAATK